MKTMRWAIMVLLSASFASIASAQPVNLEELEARLKRAQAEETAQKADGQRKAEAERRRQAQMGTLVIEADAACELRIDGEHKATLKPGEVKSVQVQSGQQLIDCVSTASPDVKVREVREVQAGTKLVLTLSLATRVNQPAAGTSRLDGQAFLARNKSAAGVMTTASGLQFQVLKVGVGPRPSATDTVTVHYVGSHIDGTLFDSSRARGAPATFPLNGVIRGWTEGLTKMPVGSTYRFWIPPELAYGENAPSVIGPNAVLLFEVELLSIN